MAKPAGSDGWQNESGWAQPTKTDEPVDATKDSWESNTSKNDDKRQSVPLKKRGGNSSSLQEQSGWGAAPKNKDSGGWGTSSSNYEEVENWGITKADNDDTGDWNTSPTNNKENKSDWDDPTDNSKDIGDTENWPTINENKGDSGETGWGNPTEDKGVGEVNWSTLTTEDQSALWDSMKESENSIKNTTEWVNNQKDYSNDYPRRDDRPRGRGGYVGRGSGRGGRVERGRGRGGRGPPRDNFRRGDNDYRGHKSYSRGGRNQNYERRDSFNENERKEREESSKFVNKKPGSIYDSIHAPRAADSDPSIHAPKAADSDPSTHAPRVADSVQTDIPTVIRPDSLSKHDSPDSPDSPDSTPKFDSSPKPDSTPKPDSAPKPDSTPKPDPVSKPDSTPYVNENRVLSGGVAHQKLSEEELSKRMEVMKKRNEKIEEKRRLVEEDEANFKKAEEVRKQKALENREIQKKKQEEEDEEKRRHEFQMLQLQQQIDEEREENAMRKNKNRDNREWDMEKRDDWNSTRNPRNNSRGGSGGRNPYRNSGSRDEDSYRNGSQNDNRDYGRRNTHGPYGNEYGGRGYRGGRGRGGDRDRGDRDRGDRGGRRGGRDRRGGGRRYSDQQKDFPSKSEEAALFGSGNSWAEQTEQQEKDNNPSVEWDSNQNNAPNTEADDNWGTVDANANNNGWD